jgi:hypothetical protein
MSWWTGPWEDCSVTCGRGTRRRSVFCIQVTPSDADSLENELEQEELEVVEGKTTSSIALTVGFRCGLVVRRADFNAERQRVRALVQRFPSFFFFFFKFMCSLGTTYSHGLYIGRWCISSARVNLLYSQLQLLGFASLNLRFGVQSHESQVLYTKLESRTPGLCVSVILFIGNFIGDENFSSLLVSILLAINRYQYRYF